MKLVTYTFSNVKRLGAVVESSVVDLPVAYAEYQLSQGVSKPDTVAFPTDLVTFLQSGEAVWQSARDTLAWASVNRHTKQAEAFIRPVADLEINPPVTSPSKIICVGLNYADHCRETNTPQPERPVLFAKFTTAMIGHEQPVTWPEGTSQQVDYEAELAVVIGREARGLSADNAMDAVAGYTMMNDVTARDWQNADGQWTRAKSFDTFGPIGPVLVTKDEIADPHELDIRCRLNGELMQNSNTRELIFNIPVLIEYISRTCTLLPGDIISTGTPGGVGVGRDPQVFLQPGDVVEVEVEGIGVLRSPVK